MTLTWPTPVATHAFSCVHAFCSAFNPLRFVTKNQNTAHARSQVSIIIPWTLRARRFSRQAQDKYLHLAVIRRIYVHAYVHADLWKQAISNKTKSFWGALSGYRATMTFILYYLFPKMHTHTHTYKYTHKIMYARMHVPGKQTLCVGFSACYYYVSHSKQRFGEKKKIVGLWPSTFFLSNFRITRKCKIWR